MRQTTQADIARDLGISQFTVSKAIRGTGSLSEACRQRILNRAAELGYSPNRLARSMKNGRTPIVGYLAPAFSGQYFVGLERSIQLTFSARGYNVLLSEHRPDEPVDDVPIQTFLDFRVAGIIACPLSVVPWEESVYARLPADTPIVYVDTQVTLPGAHSLFSDDVSGMRQIVEHLVARGHRCIAYVAPRSFPSYVNIRRTGFEAAMTAVGLEPLVCGLAPKNEEMMQEAGSARMHEFLFEQHPEVTALVCWNDPLAMQVMKALRGFGLDVPRDLSLVGYGDDIAYMDEQRTPLTTVCQHPEKIGQKAAQSLSRLMRRQDVPTAQSLPVSLVVRQSVAPPRASLLQNSP